MIFTKMSGGLHIQNGNEQILITPWGKNALRVQGTKNRAFSGEDKGLLPGVEPISAVVTEQDGGATVQNGRITCRVGAQGDLTFLRDGQPFLREYYRAKDVNEHSKPLKIEARQYTGAGENYGLCAKFISNPKEKLFGMGQYQQPNLNLKGCVLELAQRNSQVSVPFYLSSDGYGFLWNNPGIGEVCFGLNYTQWTARCSAELDYWVTVGNTPKEILEQFTAVAGRAPAYPENAMGLWQCKLRYRTQEEVLQVAREYHRRSIALDVIVIDFFHWPHLGDWCFDPVLWPDPKAMVQELKGMGIRCMVSVWPNVEGDSVNFKELSERGLLVRTVKGAIHQPAARFGRDTVFLDATHPEAGPFAWQKVKENYYDHGIDLFWLDEIEPEFITYEFDCYNYYIGPAAKYTNLYPREYTKVFYEGMRAQGREDIVNLVRCTWVGSQQYAALLWSGDVKCNFTALRDQLAGGLNVGMAGIPWWCSDTGGFMYGDINDPEFHELLVRWFQFSTFTAALRMHGERMPYDQTVLPSNGGGNMRTGAPNELWSYGEEPYRIMCKYVELRNALKPYIRSVMEEASANGSPVIRPMFYEFPHDPHCWELENQYMFGTDYLVAPILYAGQRERNVYLPAGQWQNIHTGEMIMGGQAITAAAPLDIIPVYKKA